MSAAKKPVPEALEREAARLVTLMAHAHRGAASGINAKRLASSLGITERHLRRVITAAREQGAALCGHPRTGYYIAATADELQQAGAWLESRAMQSLRLLAQMRRCSLPDLLGQLRLPT